jgi:hypothetical protein
MKKAQPEESGEKAPLWIISFADMISLLMAFFVMLQTLASEHTNELFTTGRGRFEATIYEFQRNINGFGIPGLVGNIADNRMFKSPRTQYHFDSPDTERTEVAARDGEEEKLRRIFTTLSQSAKTDRPQLKGKIQDSFVLPVHFTPDGRHLDSNTVSLLTSRTAVFRQSETADEGVVFYIVGQAGDVSHPAEQWLISEKRARSVADFLCTVLPESLRDNVYWWGAGAGGQWFDSVDKNEIKNHVLIVTLITASR